jgi:hypothetical protein
LQPVLSLAEAVAVISAVIALIAAYAAMLSYRINLRRHLTESLLRIADRLENKDRRSLRRTVYRLSRLEHSKWSSDQKEAVDTWAAELDLISLLLSAKQIDRQSFFQIYGDVVIRSIYQLAPYANAQRQERGRQFLLPLGRLVPQLIRQWQSESRRHNYPEEIGTRGGGVRVSLAAFREDEACRRFTLETHNSRLAQIRRFLRRHNPL